MPGQTFNFQVFRNGQSINLKGPRFMRKQTVLKIEDKIGSFSLISNPEGGMKYGVVQEILSRTNLFPECRL